MEETIFHTELEGGLIFRHLHLHVLYRGKLLMEKLSRIFQFYIHPWNLSPWNFRHTTPIYAISLTFHKSFLREMLPSNNPWKFSPSKVSCYTVCFTPAVFIYTFHISPPKWKLLLLYMYNNFALGSMYSASVSSIIQILCTFIAILILTDFHFLHGKYFQSEASG